MTRIHILTAILLFTCISVISSCSSKREAKYGDTVKVHYTGRLEDGTEFESSRLGEPLEFTIGSGEMMPDLENGLIDMKPGDRRTITLPPEEAFGQFRPELVGTVSKTSLAEDLEPVIGQQLKMKRPDGEMFDVVVIDVKEDSVTLDANHPLAGKTLIFDIELVEIK